MFIEWFICHECTGLAHGLRHRRHRDASWVEVLRRFIRYVRRENSRCLCLLSFWPSGKLYNITHEYHDLRYVTYHNIINKYPFYQTIVIDDSFY